MGRIPLIQTRFLTGSLLYDGSQMEALWAYRFLGLAGDSIVAFVGPCRVPLSRMIDLEDWRAKAKIQSPRMVHWIAEHFETDLEKAVLRQRILASLAQAELVRRGAGAILRKGDDLYDGHRKLSISIAASTGVSTKIHFAVNVVEARTVGVPTGCLADYGVNVRSFAKAILNLYCQEMEGVYLARCKARPVP